LTDKVFNKREVFHGFNYVKVVAPLIEEPSIKEPKKKGSF